VRRRLESAFVLGAGLGTRLKALTEDRPKPLVPVFDRPLISFAFDHLKAFGVSRFVVNTHHRADAYDAVFPEVNGQPNYRGCEVRFRHEPVLLETGGGIKNAEDLLTGGDFFVHNGDVLADLDLQALVDSHFAGGHLVTLGLRSHGGPTQVSWDAGSGLVTDIRSTLKNPGTHQTLFTGIYVASPRLFSYFQPGQVASVVPAFLEAIRQGVPVGGVLLDDGHWFDLGTIESYKDIHRRFQLGLKFSHAPSETWPLPVHPSSRMEEGVELRGAVSIGPGAQVAGPSILEDCILWPGAKTASRIHLRDCIVRTSAMHSATSEIL
jgi:NDP-sugar pyrophosphorylase family protein